MGASDPRGVRATERPDVLQADRREAGPQAEAQEQEGRRRGRTAGRVAGAAVPAAGRTITAKTKPERSREEAQNAQKFRTQSQLFCAFCAPSRLLRFGA